MIDTIEIPADNSFLLKWYFHRMHIIPIFVKKDSVHIFYMKSVSN